MPRKGYGQRGVQLRSAPVLVVLPPKSQESIQRRAQLRLPVISEAHFLLKRNCHKFVPALISRLVTPEIPHELGSYRRQVEAVRRKSPREVGQAHGQRLGRYRRETRGA